MCVNVNVSSQQPNWQRAAEDFAPGVDSQTGRYSVLGSFPAIPSIHQAMHDYHSQSEVMHM